ALPLVCILVRVLARKEVATFDSNILRVYGLPRHSSFAKRFFKQCVRAQLFCALDTIRAIYRPGSVRFEGVDNLRRNIEETTRLGKGVICCAAHIGSWELTGHLCAKSLTSNFYVL